MLPASVYIGGLPETTTRSELNDHLSIYGRVTALNIHKGYTFVEFESEADALDFVVVYADQPFLGTVCKIELAKQPRRQSKANRSRTPEANVEARSSPESSRVRYPVVVYNLNPQTCWQELKDFGRRTGGTVAFCDIDKNNRRRGFLEYYTQEDADRVVKELDGQELLGYRVTLNSYGKKTLREEHTDSCSPTMNRPHSRSPTMNRDNRFRRSRSPLEMSRHQNAPCRNPYNSPHHRGRQNSSPRKFQSMDRTFPEYPPRHDDRHARFASREVDRMLGRSRSPSKARRPTDFYDDLGYVSEERRIRMDRLADEWQAYNRLTPPKF